MDSNTDDGYDEHSKGIGTFIHASYLIKLHAKRSLALLYVTYQSDL
jgi:hypothetical protein